MKKLKSFLRHKSFLHENMNEFVLRRVFCMNKIEEFFFNTKTLVK